METDPVSETSSVCVCFRIPDDGQSKKKKINFDRSLCFQAFF
jgi:hypothetical protein